LLEYIIKPVMSQFPEYVVRRQDKDSKPGMIDSQIIIALRDADLVIADLSFVNPNAFYEIGIGHMATEPIIHMQLESQRIPFDLSLYKNSPVLFFESRAHRYADAMGGIESTGRSWFDVLSEDLCEPRSEGGFDRVPLPRRSVCPAAVRASPELGRFRTCQSADPGEPSLTPRRHRRGVAAIETMFRF